MCVFADISDTEWIVIVLVLVIVLVVLIITVAKCLEIGRDVSDKSLLKVGHDSYARLAHGGCLFFFCA